MKKMKLKRWNDAEREKVEQGMFDASGELKVFIGGAANATFCVLGNLLDNVQSHPNYKHKAKFLFGQVRMTWRLWEKSLRHNSTRFFHLKDFNEEAQKRYANLSDSEYFEWWQGIGIALWDKNKNWVSMLAHKYELSLIRHGEENAKIMGDCLATISLMQLTKNSYDLCKETAMKRSGFLTEDLFDSQFRVFNVQPILDILKRAVEALQPTAFYDLEPDEDHDIESAIFQVLEKWNSTSEVLSSIYRASDHYQEAFRTKGEYKKFKRELQEDMAKAIELEHKLKRENREHQRISITA